MLVVDFTFVGLILICIGLIWLFRKNRLLSNFIIFNLLLTGPLFLFYAAFPLLGPFMGGVNERFLITNYLFLGITLSFGVYSLSIIISRILQKLIRYKEEVVTLFVTLLFGFLPFTLFFINYPKTDMSKSDEGSNYARDILKSANPPGILFLSGDTTVFNTLYEHYVEGVNKDSVIIGPGRLKLQDYRIEVRRSYPNLSLSDDFTSGGIIDASKPLIDIIYDNKDKFPIYSVYKIPVPDTYEWVHLGMVMRLYKKGDRPDAEKLSQLIYERINNFEYDVNKTRKKYINFFTEEIMNAYADAFASNAEELAIVKDYNDAKKYFEMALENNPDSIRAAIGLGQVYSKTGNCKEAEKIFTDVIKRNSKAWEPYRAMSDLYKDCFHDEAKSSDYKKRAEWLMNSELAKPVNQL